MIVDAILGLVGFFVDLIAGLLPEGHLTLPDPGPLNDVLGQVDSLIPIAGPLQAAVLVLGAVLAFVTLRLFLVLWNLLWP